MNKPVQREDPTTMAATVSLGTAKGNRLRLIGFGLFVAVLVSLFYRPLIDLAQYALKENLYSHIFLIPFVSGYLCWLRRHDARSPLATSWRAALIAICTGAVLVSGYGIARHHGYQFNQSDYLTITTLAFLACILAGGFLHFGAERLRQNLFPIAFLIFMVPMPDFLTKGISHSLQHGSADVSYGMLHLTGTPVFRQGYVFQLPGISLEVAEECSGIRSTLVLFITSLLAGQLFLRSPWKRAIFTAVVLPIAIFRNALRIVTIAMLCVHVDPSMINSVVHKRGGPFFFILSLIPFFFILWWLRKSETKLNHVDTPQDQN